MSNISNEGVSNRSIGKATAWSLASEIAAKIIVPITNIILARLLAPEAFGIIATINMVVSFADTFSTAGFQKYIIQHDFENKESLFKSANVGFWINLAISVFAWIVIAIFNNQIANIVGNPGYGIPLTIASLSLPLTSFSVIQEALFQRKLNFKILFYRRVLVSLLPFLVTIPLAYVGFGYWSLIIGSIASNLFKGVLLTIASEWKPAFYFNLQLLKEMFSFSMWTLFESISMWASSYIDILIISNGLGSYFTGIYKNSQTTVTSILTIVTGATTSVLFSSLSRMQNDEKRFSETFYAFQKNVAIFVLPIGVGILCFCDLITDILLGKKWSDASEFIGIWGLCTSLVCVFGTFSREVYRAKGRPKISLIVQLLHLAFIIPVCIYGVKKGFHTLIYIRSFSYLQIILLHMIFIKLIFHLSPLQMVMNAKEPILCSILMGFVAKILLNIIQSSTILQFLYIIICALLYFMVLYMFKDYRLIFNQFLVKFYNKYSTLLN